MRCNGGLGYALARGRAEHVDPAYVLWATARLVDVDALPTQQVTVRVHLRDMGGGQYWLLLHRPSAEICTHYPGTSEDLVIHTDAEALARWHLRELSYPQLLREQRIRIDGPSDLVRAFPRWIRPSPYAMPAGPGTSAGDGRQDA